MPPTSGTTRSSTLVPLRRKLSAILPSRWAWKYQRLSELRTIFDQPQEIYLLQVSTVPAIYMQRNNQSYGSTALKLSSPRVMSVGSSQNIYCLLDICRDGTMYWWPLTWCVFLVAGCQEYLVGGTSPYRPLQTDLLHHVSDYRSGYSCHCIYPHDPINLPSFDLIWVHGMTNYPLFCTTYNEIFHKPRLDFRTGVMPAVWCILSRYEMWPT